MKKTIFEGKVTLADRLVDFRIFKELDEEGMFLFYSYETNPELKDKNQIDYHRGQTLRALTLEDLLFQFEWVYKKEFKEIDKERNNPFYLNKK